MPLTPCTPPTNCSTKTHLFTTLACNRLPFLCSKSCLCKAKCNEWVMCPICNNSLKLRTKFMHKSPVSRPCHLCPTIKRDCRAVRIPSSTIIRKCPMMAKTMVTKTKASRRPEAEDAAKMMLMAETTSASIVTRPTWATLHFTRTPSRSTRLGPMVSRERLQPLGEAVADPAKMYAFLLIIIFV